ncbi:MAG TPA: PspC domain-containing protein [Bryobacteraceae bacterium]|nr:PspC domain-containing protein [Bryobacteraceae bacterium]
MFCTRCGVSLDDKAKFCSQCGAPSAANAYSAPAPYPKLSRPREDRKIAGVCAGLARYMGVDVTLVRLIALIMIFWPIGIGLIGYIVAWIVMPNDPLRLPEPAPLHSQPAGGHV